MTQYLDFDLNSVVSDASLIQVYFFSYNDTNTNANIIIIIIITNILVLLSKVDLVPEGLKRRGNLAEFGS